MKLTPLAVHTKRLRGRRLQERRCRWFELHPLCEACLAKGVVAQADQLDHIVPMFKGGTDLPDNWQGLCTSCHDEKSILERGRAFKRVGIDGYPVGG